MLDAHELEIFLAIAEDRHFVRAADRLGIAQSVASKRLKRLEDRLGTRLIDRGNRTRIALTRAGALFLDEARDALAALRQAERIGRNLARGRSGPLRIGYVFSASMTGVLSRALRALHGALPDLDLIPEPMDTPAQLRAIAEGRIDIGFVRPRPSYPAGVIARLVHREAMILAASEDHPLVARPAVRVADLAGAPFIIPQFHEEVGLIEAIRNVARLGRFPLPPIMRTGDFISAASLAAAGVGVVLAPESVRNLRIDGLRFLDIVDYADQLDLVMIHRTDAPQDAVAVLRMLPTG